MSLIKANYRGAYDSGSIYSPNDVTMSGSLWINSSTSSISGTMPISGSGPWSQFVYSPSNYLPNTFYLSPNLIGKLYPMSSSHGVTSMKATNSDTASMAVTASFAQNSSTASNTQNASSASYATLAVNSNTSSLAQNALTSSWLTNGPQIRQNVVSITSLLSSVNVTFDVPMTTTNYNIIAIGQTGAFTANSFTSKTVNGYSVNFTLGLSLSVLFIAIEQKNQNA